MPPAKEQDLSNRGLLKFMTAEFLVPLVCLIFYAGISYSQVTKNSDDITDTKKALVETNEKIAENYTELKNQQEETNDKIHQLEISQKTAETEAKAERKSMMRSINRILTTIDGRHTVPRGTVADE